MTGSLGPGGKERQLSYLLKALSDQCSIQLIVFNEQIFYKEILAMPIQLYVFKKRARYTISTIFQTYKALAEFSPDIIHAWDNMSQFIALPYIISHRVKVVNGSIRYAGKIKKSITFRIIQKVGFVTSDLIVSNSEAGTKVENLQESKKTTVIHNGFDFSAFGKEKGTPKNNLKTLVKRFTHSIVMVARFDPSKDYITFIEAAKILAKTNPNVGFFCIGDGPNRKQAETQAGPLLNRSIFFLGQRSDLHQIIHFFDVGVLLSNTNGHAEGISNAIMEYMVAGLPVVATDAGGTPELFKDRKCGFLVPAFDAITVAKKFEYLIENEHIRNEMGIKAIEIIEDDFSIQKMATSYSRLYTQLTAKNHFM